MNMSTYNYFAPANTFVSLLERNKSLLEETKRLKMKLKAFQNQKSNNQNTKIIMRKKTLMIKNLEIIWMIIKWI